MIEEHNKLVNEETLSKSQEDISREGFALLGLDEAILRALTKMGFKEPSDIQKAAIPLIQQGKDLIALAQTGSGKTAACAIPICDKVDPRKGHIQVLIVVPTRELALQYATEAQKIGGYKGVKAFAIFGGEDATLQQSKLKSGVQILVATPGRLIDFIYSRQIDLSHVETLVLDEADEMLSMGFYDDLEFVIQCLIHTHQTLLFSATMPPKIVELAKKHMRSPSEVNLSTQGRKSPEALKHFFVYATPQNKDEILVKIIEEAAIKQAIVFCQSRIQVEKMCRLLKSKFSGVDFLHAGLEQEMRSMICGKFRSGKVKILVATDVVARGLDFSRVSHVFMVQLPSDPDVYVHRSGRTARFDKEGAVLTLVTHRELPHLKTILRHIQREAEWIGAPPPAQKRRSAPRKEKGDLG